MIHTRVLALFGSICRLSDNSVEKRNGRWQLWIKSYSSHSWFVIIKELLIQYDLDSPLYLMDAKLSKSQWRVRVAKAVKSYWIGRLTSEATLYSTLKNMNCTLLIPGKCHPLLFNLSGGVHEASRIPDRLRIATGTYILQLNTISLNVTVHVTSAVMLMKHSLISCWNVRLYRNVDNRLWQL